MIRRLQLLDDDNRSSGSRLAAVWNRLRDGLLRDNKVVPAVLGFLALIIFAWLIVGALIGGPSEEEQQAANQASLSQGEDSDSGDSETPAPGVENRDTDSYSAFESKDPFRDILSKEGGSGSNPPQSGSRPDDGDRPGGSRPGGDDRPGNGDGPGDDSPDDDDRPGGNGPGSSATSGSPDPGSPDPGQPDTPQPGAPQPGAPQPGAPQPGTGDLFNSGGDMPLP